MTKPIGKSKRQLAHLLIEAGVKQFPEGVNWAAQDRDTIEHDHPICFYANKPHCNKGSGMWNNDVSASCVIDKLSFKTIIPNWHQTVLSRAEFDQIVAEGAEQSKPDADGWIEWNGVECPVSRDAVVDVRFSNGLESLRDRAGDRGWDSNQAMRITAYRLHKSEQVEPQYCESVTRSIPEPVTAPTLDQLLQDYRNAADFAARKQVEADEAAKMRDERWQAVQARAGGMGVHISIELVVDAEMRESEPVITDWRDLRVGDVVMVTGCNQNPGWNRLAGVELDVVETGDSPDDLYFKPKGGERWCCSDNTRWCFIRRP